MNRMTNFSKILIGAVLGASIFFAIQYFMGNKNLTDITNTATQTEETTTTKEEVAEPIKKANPKKNNTTPFEYKPPAVVGGKLMGVVELGASGFNSFIIRKDSEDNWEREKYEWGNSFVFDQMANGEDIVTGLKKYIINILDYGVSGRNIHFVVSSGALKEAKTKKIINTLKKMGYVINTVSPEEEGRFALRCVLPKEYENNSFVVDVGSGNTKISWYENNRIISKEGHGAKYYVRELGDSEVYNQIRKIGEEVPSSLTKTCFIIGGVPFNFAKQSRVGNERFTVLEQPKGYLSLAEDKGRKIECGLNIYQSLVDGTGCQKFVFDWDANFSIGFLLSRPG